MRSTGHRWVQASIDDASMWPPSEKRKLDVFKRAGNKATDDRAIARIMHILMRCVLSQRKVRVVTDRACTCVCNAMDR